MLDTANNELPVVPDDVSEDWVPEGYQVPEYDDPGDIEESEHDNG